MKLKDIMTREEFEAWGNEDLASWMARWSPEYAEVVESSLRRPRPVDPFDGEQYLDEDNHYWMCWGKEWISLRDFQSDGRCVIVSEPA